VLVWHGQGIADADAAAVKQDIEQGLQNALRYVLAALQLGDVP